MSLKKNEIIEQDAVLEKIESSAMWARSFGELYEVVQDMPAADVASVRHGEWIVCGDGDNVPWMCSHCGKTTAHKYKVMYGKYCPNCGSMMMEG